MSAPGQTLQGQLRRFVDVKPAEIKALLWAFAYFFFLLASYYILRPLRDEMGVAAGRDNLQWLFTATFVVMLIVSPLYGLASARLPRAKLIPAVYHFFAFNLVLFWALLSFGTARALTAQVFFVWVSVFVLFAVSVFWTFMADLFASEQGKRLFGFIAAGGTAGTLAGSTTTFTLAHLTGIANLLLVAALLLECAVFCARRLEQAAAVYRASQPKASQDKPAQDPVSKAGEGKTGDGSAIGGGMFDGFKLLLGSPYLAGIALWVAFLSLTQTFLYFIQNDVVRAASTDPAVRTKIFAAIDLGSNICTLILQLVVTGELIKRLGAGRAAACLPLVFAAGFAAIWAAPGLAAVAVFQVVQRLTNYSFANPAREIFFTVASREEKYKTKNIIDTTVLRGGDVVWGWSFAGLRALGLSATGIALAAIPAALAWLALSLWLGRQQDRRAQPESSKSQ